MKKTREEILECRSPDCGWSLEQIDAAMSARFPGTKPIDIKKLVRSWLDDKKLTDATLLQCAMLARRITRVYIKGGMGNGPMANPRGYLEHVHAEL